MYIHYDRHTDYLEVLYEKVANYGEASQNGIIILKSEKAHKKIGYGIEEASERIKELDLFTPFEKLSILIKMTRIRKGYTQEQIAKKMGIKLLPYQRLESGTNNPTLKTILKLKEILPDLELALVA